MKHKKIRARRREYKRRVPLSVLFHWFRFSAWFQKGRSAQTQRIAMIGCLVWFLGYAIVATYREQSKPWVFVNDVKAEVLPVREIEAPEQESVKEPETVAEKIRATFPDHPEKASDVFWCESHHVADRHSKVDLMADGRAFSVGVAQINLTWTPIGGLNCPEAFSGKNKFAKVVDEELYYQCVAAAEDADLNLEAARKKFDGRGDFSAWSICDNKTK